MSALAPASGISLYVILILAGLLVLLLSAWQLQVLRGRAMPNPDGSVDDWHEQPVLYGAALTDLILILPATVATFALILASSPWGFWLFGMLGFWFVDANLRTTLTSLRLHNPKITLQWLFVFPLGILVGAAMLAWLALHVEFVVALHSRP